MKPAYFVVELLPQWPSCLHTHGVISDGSPQNVEEDLQVDVMMQKLDRRLAKLFRSLPDGTLSVVLLPGRSRWRLASCLVTENWLTVVFLNGLSSAPLVATDLFLVCVSWKSNKLFETCDHQGWGPSPRQTQTGVLFLTTRVVLNPVCEGHIKTDCKKNTQISRRFSYFTRAKFWSPVVPFKEARWMRRQDQVLRNIL